ncbi:hypothetical protein FA95DRAFT_1563128 [Auriscalpium vulgare]|uniref:Uncharacterized protein n=2 Tax=Auriscalpium vulgare TaxID=40419 RepID=A0ACB8R1C7_9AGAM|nr:hypothetical protein FA95DRAFT_1567981 [Auriscalpium vulgare]KAI0043596.1 hypothetical protein FA95DRAFT_1563128 [Auriscalpium vulgare]
MMHPDNHNDLLGHANEVRISWLWRKCPPPHPRVRAQNTVAPVPRESPRQASGSEIIYISGRIVPDFVQLSITQLGGSISRVHGTILTNLVLAYRNKDRDILLCNIA